MVAYKTVIAPGEYYITPGVAVVSKLHWSLPRFKAALSLLTARAPTVSLHPPPGYKKSIGFQIAEERTRLILNGYSSRACLFFGPPVPDMMRATLVALEPDVDLWHPSSFISWCYHFHVVRWGGLSLCLMDDTMLVSAVAALEKPRT